MTDVFIRYNPQHTIRGHLALAVVSRWKLDKDANITLLTIGAPAGDFLGVKCIAVPRDQFWTRAKQYAEDNAKSEIYVVADDDQLIIGKDWVKRGVEILQAHPEFGLLSAHSVNGEVQETTEGDEQIFTIQSSVGCPYFMRKGAIKKFPESEGNE